MEYNEEQFKKSANLKTLVTWILIGSVMTLAYLIEVKNGSRTLPFFIAFCSICWLPVIIGALVLKICGWTTKLYREIFHMYFQLPVY